ncbi:dehydrogenase, partial [Mycobacterium sp. ITM-2017-0098]
DIDRTCAELEHGDSWRRLLGPLSADCDGVVGLLLGDKRSIPPRIPAALRVAPRLLAQGSPAWGSLAGEDARALFTGVAAHTISQ